MAKETKNKGGRPPEKVEDKVDYIQIGKLAALGLTDVEIGSVIGVCEDTINNYKKDEEFLRVLKAGKAKADARVVESLYKRATGFRYAEKTFEAIKLSSGKLSKAVKVKTVIKNVEPNVTACIYWLNNRRPGDWRGVKDGDAPAPEAPHTDKIDNMIADAEKRAREADQTCH